MEARGRRVPRGCHSVLPGSGFGNYPGLAHALDQQSLTHDIVDLMGPGVVQVFPLDINPRPCKMLCKVFCKCEGRGPAGIATHQRNVLLPECRVLARLLVESMDQWDETAYQDHIDLLSNLGRQAVDDVEKFLRGDTPLAVITWDMLATTA